MINHPHEQNTETTRLRVAVVGAGVAGIVSAWLLSKKHDVVLLEKEGRLGGHTNTVEIKTGPDAGTAVDTGFIVCNDRTYPTFHRFLNELNVPVRDADMSFGFHCDSTGFHYAGTTLNGLLAQRGNLLRPSFYSMLRNIASFNKRAPGDLESRALAGRTLGAYLEELRYGKHFRDFYLLPMGAAIWSTNAREMLDFPAETFLRFFANHGLLSIADRPQWQTVVGGSSAYLRAFERLFKGTWRTSVELRAIERTNNGVIIHHADASSENFDRVVIATHADQALGLLADPSEEERALLGAWKYAHNPTVLHTDTSFLPPNQRAWASWNYRRESQNDGETPLSVTYHMNRLQGLRTQSEFCVTLNSQRSFKPGSVIAEFPYTHPQFTFASVATQQRLPQLNGQRHTYFAGSYFGYGFHEDAVKSGAEVGRSFGVML